MRILITGVAGHIGSRLAKHISDVISNAHIVGVDDLSCGYRENIPPCVDFREHDLTKCCDFGSQRYDYIFHCAAYAAECASPFMRVFNYKSNVIATMQVLNHALRTGCERFVYFSSMAAYGDVPAPMDEMSECHPKDPYGLAKLMCENDLRIAGEQHGLSWCVLRPHNVYGPGQSIWQKYRNVFGLWMRAALEERPAIVFGDGTQERAFSYIDDILPAIWQAAIAPAAHQQVINIGGSHAFSIRDASVILQSIIGDALRFEHAPPRYEVKQAYCTTIKSEELLGYEDRTTLDSGLRAMWYWAQAAWE